MALLYITEFSQLGFSSNAGQLIAAPSIPPLATQSIGVTTASVTSTTFGQTTFFIEINTDTACCLACNTASVTGSWRMGANETRYYSVRPGSYIATISTT